MERWEKIRRLAFDASPPADLSARIAGERDPIERMLRSVYGRDESFQLLLTFALVLMFQDVFRFFWGANPRSLDNAYLVYGAINARGFGVPVYNVMVILAAIATVIDSR